MRVIDISNPIAPNEVGLHDTFGPAYDVAVRGSYAYMAAGPEDLRVIDVSNPPQRPAPPKGQQPDSDKVMKENLDKAIEDAANKLSHPFNPSKYSGYYKYWCGLCDAREIITKKVDSSKSG